MSEENNNSAPKSNDQCLDEEAGASEKLDPKIAHHSSYLDETKTLLREYAECQSHSELKRRVVEENLLKKDTDYYRKNILREVTRRYIPDTDSYTETQLIYLLSTVSRDDIVDWCLYYEFSQDPFIKFVTREYLYPEYDHGTLTIRSEDIFEFLQSVKNEHPGLSERTDGTIDEAATKYLASMKNFGLLEGRQEKEFAPIYIPNEPIAYVTYRLFDEVDAGTAVIEHEDWELLFMTEEDVRRRMRDISPTYVTYEKRGSTERLTPAFNNAKEAIDAF